MSTTTITQRSTRSRVLAFGVVMVMVLTAAFAFSTTQTYAASAPAKYTLYKGQAMTVTYYASSSISLKASKTGIVAIKRISKNYYQITAKKAGTVTLTASGSGYYTKKYTFTVPSSYPTGSMGKPLTIGSNWVTLKNKSGSKQIMLKSTIMKDAEAKQFLIDNGVTFYSNDETLWNDPAYTSLNSFYVIKYEFNIVKGFPAGSSASLYDLAYPYQYNSKWSKLSNTQYKDFYIYSSTNSLPTTYSGFTNGATGEFYTAFWLDNTVKEIRQMDVAYMGDYQKVGPNLTFYSTYISGCSKVLLP